MLTVRVSWSIVTCTTHSDATLEVLVTGEHTGVTPAGMALQTCFWEATREVDESD